MHSPVSSVHVPESTLKHVHSTCSTCSARARSCHRSAFLTQGSYALETNALQTACKALPC